MLSPNTSGDSRRLDRHDWMALGGEIFADEYSALRLKLDSDAKADQFTDDELTVVRRELAKITGPAKIERAAEPAREELIALARKRLRRLTVEPNQVAA